MHTIIVPGVGGSDYDHWQSWLQRQIVSSSRVQQQDWNLPVLRQWVKNFVKAVANVNEPIQIVAHSFGCLTTLSALHEYPELDKKIRKIILVAPANPSRFGDFGFARNSMNDYTAYFHRIHVKIPATMIMSENDPWLDYNDAIALAKAWNIRPINLGQVGHINVASGFGYFPEIFDYLIPENAHSHSNKIDDSKLLFKYAI